MTHDVVDVLNDLLDEAALHLVALRSTAVTRPTAVEWESGFGNGVAAAVALVSGGDRDAVFNDAVRRAAARTGVSIDARTHCLP